MKKRHAVKCLSAVLFWVIEGLLFRVAAQRHQADVAVSACNTYLYTAGDARGFSVAVAGNFFVSRTWACTAEYRLAYAMTTPVLDQGYLHESLNFLESRMTVFPFAVAANAALRRTIGGLHLSAGPSVVVGVTGQETAWSSSWENGREVARTSSLRTRHLTDIGYAVTLGYRYYFRRLFCGLRIDFANYRRHDGYTAYGGGVGVIL